MSHTLILRSDEVMKFCFEDAVSAAQGGTAVRPPSRKLDWIGEEKNFFSLRKSSEKKFCRRESPSVGTEANPSSYLKWVNL